MEIIHVTNNIVDVESDVLIYSTNTRLALTGGVGALLVERFGSNIQTRLINESTSSGMELAHVGDVFNVKSDNMPWKAVLHTVCTDGSYIASEGAVRTVLKRAFEICSSLPGVSVISVSELGTGYGTMFSTEFNTILREVAFGFSNGSIHKVIVCSMPGPTKRF